MLLIMPAKKALTIIVNLLRAPFRAIDSFERRRQLPSEKQIMPLARILDHVAGFFYRTIIILSERVRYNVNYLIQMSKGWWMYRPLLGYTIKSVILSIIIFYALYLLNVLVVNEFIKDAVKNLGLDIQDLESMGDFLGYMVGALTALLAIVFAATATGFQVSASRYSSDVSQFVVENDEFLQLRRIFLVSGIFAFTTLVGFNLFGVKAYLAVLVTYLLGILMVVYVVRFSTHLFMLYKPRIIFDGLSRTIYKQITIASSTDFRSRSWSLLSQSRKSTQQHLVLLEELYTTLFRKKEYDDSYHITRSLAYLIKKFAGNAHLIQDSERPWWGNETHQLVTYDDSSLATIKSNFEIKSEGRLTIPSRDFNWFEDILLSLFRQVAQDAMDKGVDLQFKTICFAYGNALQGDYKGDKGVLQFGNLAIAQGLIDGFLAVDVDKLSLQNFGIWLETFFSLSFGVLKIETDKDFDKSITDSYALIVRGRSYHPAIKKQTGIHYNILNQYAKKIELEKAVEGRIITPLEDYRDEIRSKVRKKIEEFTDMNFIKFIDTSNKAAKRAHALKDYDLLASLIWIQYRWINHAFYNHNFERAQLINIATHENLAYLFRLPAESAKKAELLEEAEKGFFTSILEKQEDCYDTFVGALRILRLSQPPTLKEEQKIVRMARRLYAHALFVFYASEYYQDPSYLKKFFELNGAGLKVSIYRYLLIAKELESQDIHWETQTFHRWFLSLERLIEEDLKEIRDPNDNGWGIGTIYDHSSPYIQRLGSYGGAGMIDLFGASDFEDWLEAREALTELLAEFFMRGKNG